MANVLGVGVATLDWIQVVEQYPALDSEVRAEQQYLWRGGNASNTLAVLSQLGEHCGLLATLADDAFADIICTDLERHHIDYSHCPRILNSTSPASHILLSRESASRNIVHYRELRELSEQDSIGIDFSQWDWIHFEGRNIDTTLTLMKHIKQQYPRIRVSLEIEKSRESIERLYHYADHLLFSRHFVESNKFSRAEPFFRQLQDTLKKPRELICAWGSQGACALSRKGIYSEVSAAEIEAVDTRAAGDVFNAGYIHACLQGNNFEESMTAACQLAGKKCEQFGIEGLGN